ncbi:hypothetical protein I5677_03615 [Mobilitalea sibirica]|uniref:Uncharacterized protein n=1 Tax=Mobilitalea sibirica TaxID=1462919 RepID=A0A8J7L250_9FIRM|nr:hypothetical protein [Mobilitalea sibirica]MBH1939983.1 hypothetical protein [Mobilitalea sibirica]
MIDRKHITLEDLNAFKKNQMNTEQTEAFLSHICSCDLCSELLAEGMSDELIAAPLNLKENILREVKKERVSKTKALKTKIHSKQMQLLWYSLKIGTAAACAILMLIWTMSVENSANINLNYHKLNNEPIEYEETLTTVIRDNMNTISNRMLEFSNTIMKTEVIDYERKEK